MNRYVREGIIRDLRAGKRILYVAPVREANRVVQAIAASDEPWAEIRRAHGDQRIEHSSGGRVYVRSTDTSAHGLAVDVVIVDSEHIADDLDAMASLDACTNGSPCGEIMRAA